MILLDTHFVIELIDVRLGGHGEPHPHPALKNLQRSLCQCYQLVGSCYQVSPRQTSFENFS